MSILNSAGDYWHITDNNIANGGGTSITTTYSSSDDGDFLIVDDRHELYNKINKHEKHIDLLYRIISKTMNEIIEKNISISNSLRYEVFDLLEEIESNKKEKKKEDDGFIQEEEMAI